MALKGFWRRAALVVVCVVWCGGVVAQEGEVVEPTDSLRMEDVVPSEFDTYWVGFLIRPETVPDASEAEAERAQIEHLAYLRSLARQRLSLATGPLEGPEPEAMRGIVIFRGDLPRERVEALLAADPHVRRGSLRAHVLQWYTAKGTLIWPEQSAW